MLHSNFYIYTILESLTVDYLVIECFSVSVHVFNKLFDTALIMEMSLLWRIYTKIC